MNFKVKENVLMCNINIFFFFTTAVIKYNFAIFVGRKGSKRAKMPQPMKVIMCPFPV